MPPYTGSVEPWACLCKNLLTGLAICCAWSRHGEQDRLRLTVFAYICFDIRLVCLYSDRTRAAILHPSVLLIYLRSKLTRLDITYSVAFIICAGLVRVVSQEEPGEPALPFQVWGPTTSPHSYLQTDFRPCLL